MIRTKEELIAENINLRNRLIEYEEALSAIRNGDVDAIMVSGKMGEQVYSVSSAETPYRTFIEQMSEGAVTLAKDGTIIYCNSRFAEIIEVPYEGIIGSSIKRFIALEDNMKLDTFLSQLSQNSHDVLIVNLNETLYLRLSIHLLPPYLQGDNYIVIVTDISDLKRREFELNEVIADLVNHLKGLKALRIENICSTFDVVGSKNKLEVTNKILHKEIVILNRLIVKLKKKQRFQSDLEN
jgi:PAS domain S-box-containing protein